MNHPKKREMQISEVANGIVDPVLARRAGISTSLLGSWDEIAGEDFADCTRPEKITWPRGGLGRDEGMSSSGGGYQPGVLTIACEGARALFLSHAQGELIARINGFFGFPAVRQIRIVQKPVSQTFKHPRKPPPLKGEAARRLEDMMDGIESDALRKAVERLGTAVLQKKRR
ncbi:DUF721 domain-containing protein [Neorhizobium sp. SOG26]|uniref:DUF721 domain-containing protein n=1 Tax=Neorhizobium sp. SOG26 TaxID=2060726 RepID=UPI000E587AB0|nr:DUF721 domain-containing protein [Neorhizobium sp. SOG26]AXV17217.1 DUF721 domain-containing protein [Neorhizobium sp. SOG26]